MNKEDYKELFLKTVETLKGYDNLPMFDLGWDGYMTFPMIVENYHIGECNFLVHKWRETTVIQIVEDRCKEGYHNWVNHCSHKEGEYNMTNTLDETWGIEYPLEDYAIIIEALQEL